ncbi:hypothetical protein CPB86DRAFT_703242 [Serendipita vermifera]|nr:hypothetical protein CPB86DRAFT_703242 [Serendipita vermifera]
MTAGLESLPDELFLTIFDQLLPPSEGIPVTGTNAAWTPPSAVERRHLVRSHLDEGVTEWFGERAEDEDNLLPVTIPESPFTRYSALWTLRQVNRRLNDLCIPFLFHDLNLLDNTLIAEEAALALPYVNHVRSVRLLIDPVCFKLPEPEAISAYQQSVSAIVQQCRNATSIALYYNNYTVETKHFENEVMDLMKLGKVQSFGIYSNTILRSIIGSWEWNRREAVDLSRFLRETIMMPEAVASLKHLDIAVERISFPAYAKLRESVSGLTSLHIRRAFRISLGYLWESCTVPVWSTSAHLTRLSLIDCSNTYAADVPHLVGHFQGLQYLIVSTCGDDDDIIPPHRPSGWSHFPDALCKQRPPLKEFHIEHMLNWEIMAMGTIPTKKVIGSNLAKGHLAEVLETDPEIFPGLQLLSIEGQPVRGSPQRMRDSPHEYDIEKICERRGLKLTKDAKRIKQGYTPL